jgi:replicative DNA helicase
MIEDAALVPPHNLEAEMSVMGAMLLDRDAIGAVCELLRPEDFYRQAHGTLFEVIQELDGRNVEPDLVSVSEALEREGKLDEVGGKPYLVELLEVLPSAANVRHYADIVRVHAVRRRLARAGDEIRREALQGSHDSAALLDRAESVIFEIGERETARGTVAVRDVLAATFTRIEKMQESPGAVTGLDTGFYRLNDMTGGLQPGDLVVVAARPSMGKTTFALNIARNACLEGGARVLLFSLEMTEEQIAQNLLCAQAGIDATKLRKGQLPDHAWQKLSTAANDLHDTRFFIDSTPALSPTMIRTKSRRLKLKEGGLDMVIVDYLQLVASPPRAENRQQEISVISRNLKELARELRCPVVALSQLNRSVDAREDHHPRLSDLRESGAIEQDADLILFLYREDYYKGEEIPAEEGRPTEVIIAKQRNGPTGKVLLQFRPSMLRFENPAVESYA